MERIEESYFEDDDMSEQSDPPWINEYPIEDLPEDFSQPMQTTPTPLEATAELSRFRPIHGKPSELKHLLESKADTNMPLKLGDITPLRTVMCFAPETYVANMRNLLLEFGANESGDVRKR